MQSFAQHACIERTLRTYFNSELSVIDAEDPAAFRAQMLLDEDNESVRAESNQEVNSIPIRSILIGVSGASYVTQLTVILYTWHLTETNPLQSYSILTPESLIEGVTAEYTSRQRILNVSVGEIHTFVATVVNNDSEKTLDATFALVKVLGGARGILTLLGFQHTVGSRNVAPLTLRQCLAAFAQRHNNNELLTVGARAYTKHCTRSSSGWWGELKGNDAAKNVQAEAKVRDLLATATWKNIHSLPHGHATMEIRNSLGYGARWDAETRHFRGFLEPPMLNGHAIKWRH
ncbi:uncharacterized protein PHALS_03874 [Plasmopara halstedii]|uniref:Uncharacterized protein n=1 Tax=Plasmopara halstedii TaxID=4781 RepID=A0A0P1B0P5_PLAHL|nr:uncharacterized protein PHALS_03874 [Plasmopara halstedii]CEG47226.1 hypothetical protein PHALS_03874 [Plasmopara halstedii]|eukprot:XP_024583595.1 hypothetical protein PHALS_03874 [Plasmopara halstedii]